MWNANRVLKTSFRSPWTWHDFTLAFVRMFGGGVAVVYLFVALLDPFGVLPLSLPIERPIVSINQRHMYPQIILSRRFDSLIVGTSTARLLDPDDLNGPFRAKFANLAMNSMMAWEQQTVIDFFVRKNGPPKVLVVALDVVWCDSRADQNKIAFGFPVWMYDDNPWNEYLYLLNFETVEIAGRLVGNKLGLYRERVRRDGYEVFTAPEDQYEPAKARRNLWGDRVPEPPPALAPPRLDDASRLSFPALSWLDARLRALPSTTTKILAFMPVHVTAQPWPGTEAAAIEAECKTRISAIAARNGAKVIDWRIASPITTTDTNYWDPLHYRLPIAHRLARDLAAAAIHGQPAADGSYRIVVP